MTRLNLLLLLVLVACALATVTAQHKARRLFVQLENDQALARELEVEWGQLQLEQSTWAMHGRVARIAEARLGMLAPSGERLRVLVAPAEREPR